MIQSYEQGHDRRNACELDYKGPERRTVKLDCQNAEAVAVRVSEETVRRAFLYLGVDVTDVDSLREFQRNMEFAGDMRAAAKKGVFAMISTVAALVIGAFIAGFKIKIGG